MHASYISSQKRDAEILSPLVLEMGYEIADHLESKGMSGIRSEIEDAVEGIGSGEPDKIQSGALVLDKWSNLYKALNPG